MLTTKKEIVGTDFNKLLDNYETHFLKRMSEYWGVDQRFYEEYYGYLRIIQDLKAHLKVGKIER